MTRFAVVLLAAGFLLTTGCERKQDAGMPPHSPEAAGAPAGHAAMEGGASGMKPMSGTPHDAWFIDAMIPHHQAAVDMARQALSQAEHEEIRVLAQSILTSQQAEIDQMKAWRETWYPGLARTSGGDDAMKMEGMRLSDDAKVPFDERFIDAMIPHHESAVVMATRAKTEAEHAELEDLAVRIVSAQQAEIESMKRWRAEWFAR